VTFQVPIYQGNEWDRLSDNTIQDDYVVSYCKVFKIDPEKLSASQELAEKVESMIYCAERSYDELNRYVDEISEKYGYEYGMTLGAVGENGKIRTLILADGTPLSHISRVHYVTEMAQRLQEGGRVVRNTWKHQGDQTVSVIQTDEGPIALSEYQAGDRHRKWIEGLSVRTNSQLTVEAELKAIELLKTKITESQFRCYILNGAFPEHSKRSDLYYFFRKGLPTLVYSWHDNPQGKILAALCLHPYGYYAYTHVGVMTPTDEVIAHLMLMRADERKYWAKSGQWHSDDNRSGL
jgi:hypothetical protein